MCPAAHINTYNQYQAYQFGYGIVRDEAVAARLVILRPGCSSLDPALWATQKKNDSLLM